ncbi:hypothetical protein N7475_004852 [Penicillium sp. IBT 31633x]|nr:hypothetical protein N7475_004852 [Penicillium sp. IBT 31633x]
MLHPSNPLRQNFPGDQSRKFCILNAVFHHLTSLSPRPFLGSISTSIGAKETDTFTDMSAMTDPRSHFTGT